MCENKKIWTPDGYEMDSEEIARGLYRADLSGPYEEDWQTKQLEFIGTTAQPAAIARAVLAGKPPNLIGSKIHGTSYRFAETYHAPVLDFDQPLRIKKSSTPGHHHILVDSWISDGSFKEAMYAMAKAGLQQQGFASQLERYGQTFIRWNTTKDEEQ